MKFVEKIIRHPFLRTPYQRMKYYNDIRQAFKAKRLEQHQDFIDAWNHGKFNIYRGWNRFVEDPQKYPSYFHEELGRVYKK